jgi:hypothetical protein
MATPLGTYIHDHLAGAQFVAQEVEADRKVLQDFATRIGEEPSTAKEAAAWIVQKLSKVKLAPGDQLGAFEAIETLCLGILGKLALWNALETLREGDPRFGELDLAALAGRAREQHAKVEKLRLALAPTALLTAPQS